ncbi:cyclopropane-fatty-acyl-phospholipid synthase family protein [Candidatus Uabimicrobium sp. HlEnr_7]|uniref:SAM-dependent methyltransferase n=1 Tax=Candidatus Uabimicrobium helgolandensis TaxID=3095367 RepID=UPI003555D31E
MNFEKDIANYYNNNTSKFLRWGHGKKDFAIHRAVWFPGISDRSSAILYQNEYIYEQLLNVGNDKRMAVLDLGCGVGGSLFFLAKRFPNIDLYGLTNSDKQQELSLLLKERLQISNVNIALGDYHLVPPSIPKVDLVFAIESFVHSHSPQKLIEQIAFCTKQDSTCIIIDDFLANDKAANNRYVEIFKRNWYAPGICTVDYLQKEAARFGLVVEDVVDLTSYLELNRVRDYIIRVCCLLLRFYPDYYFRSLVGGNALRHCLLNDFIRYNVVKITKK